MKLIIDTENKTITLTENVNLGELFDYLEKHYKSTTDFGGGWRDYKLLLEEIEDPITIEPPIWPSTPNTTPYVPPYSTPPTTTPDWTWRPTIYYTNDTSSGKIPK